jgi:hypothetical protein
MRLRVCFDREKREWTFCSRGDPLLLLLKSKKISKFFRYMFEFI